MDVTAHLRWSEGVARGVAAHFRFVPGGEEEAELVSAAYLTLVVQAPRFDRATYLPDGGDEGGAFRGWVHSHVRKQCLREAIRLLNGGTYHTRREAEHAGPVDVVALAELLTPDGDPWEPPSLDPDPDEDDPDAG